MRLTATYHYGYVLPEYSYFLYIVDAPVKSVGNDQVFGREVAIVPFFHLNIISRNGNTQNPNMGINYVAFSGVSYRLGNESPRQNADSRIYVTEKLDCNLHGTGNIYVYGNPPNIIVKERTSSGQVIRVN